MGEGVLVGRPLVSGGLTHPESDGEQNRLSAFPSVPLTTE